MPRVIAGFSRAVVSTAGMQCKHSSGSKARPSPHSWIVPNSYTNIVDNRLTLYGEKGGLELKNEPALWVFTDRFHTPFSSESVTRYGKAWGFQYESIRYFIDCVAEDTAPEATGRDGLMVTAMIETTLKSLAEKRPVRLEEVFAGGPS